MKVTGGSGYTNGTYYAPIRGDGSGGVVKIEVSGGEIAAFGSLATNTQIEAAGSSYTYGTVDLTNDIFSTYNSGTGALSGATTMGAGTNGAIVPIISPKVGHGHDAIAELGGHYIMLNAKLEHFEGDDFAVGNDLEKLVSLLTQPQMVVLVYSVEQLQDKLMQFHSHLPLQHLNQMKRLHRDNNWCSR